METILLQTLLEALNTLASFGKWLVTPINYINLSPLAILSVGGVSIIIAVHVVRLFVGG